MLLVQECLCVLACDDSEVVSEAAQSFLGYLFSSSGKHHIVEDVTQMFSRSFIFFIPKFFFSCILCFLSMLPDTTLDR